MSAYRLAEHVLAMADDAYLMGHPEWAEIVDEARALHANAPELAEALSWALDQIDDDLDLDHRAALDHARDVLARALGAES
jgi:hypothetical protein